MLGFRSVQAELALGMEEEAHTIQKTKGTSKDTHKVIRFTKPLPQVVKAKQKTGAGGGVSAVGLPAG